MKHSKGKFNASKTVKMDNFSVDVDHDRDELTIYFRSMNEDLADQLRKDLHQAIQQLDLTQTQGDIVAERFWGTAENFQLSNLLFGKLPD